MATRAERDSGCFADGTVTGKRLSDPHLPPDGSVSAICRSLDAAVREAERLTKLGSHCVIANPATGIRTDFPRLFAVPEDGGDQPRPPRAS